MMAPVALRMLELVQSFPTLRDTPQAFFEPWDPEAFAESRRAGSGGEKDAALFVLSVWNPSTDWSEYGLTRHSSRNGEPCGFFDMHTALGNWDDKHRAAFLAWCAAPWWP